MRAKGCSGSSDAGIVEAVVSSDAAVTASGVVSLVGIDVSVTIFLLGRGLTPGAVVCRYDTHS